MDIEKEIRDAGGSLCIGDTLGKALSAYDSDTAYKQFKFTGYDKDVEGSWYVTMEDKLHVYHFVRKK